MVDKNRLITGYMLFTLQTAHAYIDYPRHLWCLVSTFGAKGENVGFESAAFTLNFRQKTLFYFFPDCYFVSKSLYSLFQRMLDAYSVYFLFQSLFCKGSSMLILSVPTCKGLLCVPYRYYSALSCFKSTYNVYDNINNINGSTRNRVKAARKLFNSTQNMTCIMWNQSDSLKNKIEYTRNQIDTAGNTTDLTRIRFDSYRNTSYST